MLNNEKIVERITWLRNRVILCEKHDNNFLNKNSLLMVGDREMLNEWILGMWSFSESHKAEIMKKCNELYEYLRKEYTIPERPWK